MKKLILLLSASVIAMSADAQYMRHDASVRNSKTAPPVSAQVSERGAPSIHHSGARTTTTSFVTEDFSSGTAVSLPTGWTRGTITGGTWKWTANASTSSFTMGAMTSTSAANGWMIFDSDSIGAACSCAPAGWLQSPAYNCSTHPYVRLNFEDYYRKFEDSCYVWVSTSPTFTTYSSFPVLTNNTLATNISSKNPENVHINISSAAGGQATVYLRFVTWGPDQGAYSWMIDDMSLSDLDSVDAEVNKPSVLSYSGSAGGFYSFGAMPLKMIDSIFPAAYVANYGFTALPALSVSAKIFRGATNVYSSNVAVVAPVDAYDTLADFTQGTPSGYYPNAIGSYSVPFSVNPGSDAVSANNTDTTFFDVTDSTWSMNVPGLASTSIMYVHRPAYSFSPATKFTATAGRTDTLTSVEVAFGRATKAGQVVGVQIYHFDATSSAWLYDGLTEFRALTAGEISTATATTYARFVVNETGTGGKIVLDGGANGVEYAAVVKGMANTDTVTVLEGPNPAPIKLISYTGLSDTSDNAATPTQVFGNGHLPYSNEVTPFIRLNFGIVPSTPIDHTIVHNVNIDNHVGKAFPNPANTAVSVPFTLANDAVVTATLTNVMGQVITTREINAKGSVPAKATFSTAGLTNGVYMYTLEFNSQHANGRIVVTH
jgi:hypothetical protein